MRLRPHVIETSRTDALVAPIGIRCVREQQIPQRLWVIVPSGALSFSRTSSAEPARLWEGIYESEATASGCSSEQQADTPDGAEMTRQAISELRRISGLTWEQLGELFDVSRRSVHFWASGKPLSSGNEPRLMQVLDIVRAGNRGDARSTRAALFEVREGTTAFALLAAGQFEEARVALGLGAARPKPALWKLSGAAETARKLPPPEDLVDAQHDRIHRDRGRARAARTLRNQRRGTP